MILVSEETTKKTTPQVVKGGKFPRKRRLSNAEVNIHADKLVEMGTANDGRTSNTSIESDDFGPNNPVANAIRNFINSKLFKTLVMIATFVALFGFDLTVAAFPQSFDIVTLTVLAIFFIVFSFEIIGSSILIRDYFFSFYFLLDLLGTLSLIPDLMEIYVTTQGNEDTLNVARAGRAGRLARSAGLFVSYLFSSYY